MWVMGWLLASFFIYGCRLPTADWRLPTGDCRLESGEHNFI